MEDPGWEQTKKYFRKIMNSFAVGLLWMLAVSTAGLYFRLAFFETGLQWPTAVFYVLLVLSFVALLWWYYRMWKD